MERDSRREERRHRELRSLLSLRALVARRCSVKTCTTASIAARLGAYTATFLIALLLALRFMRAHRVAVTIAMVDSGAAGAAPVLPQLGASMLVGIRLPHSGGADKVRALLERWSTANEVKLADHKLDFLELAPHAQDEYGATWGYRGFGIHRQPGWATTRRPYYFTLLVNPLHRVKRQYAAHIRGVANPASFTRWFEDDGGAAGISDAASPLRLSNSPMARQLCCWWPNPNHHGAPPAESCHTAPDQIATLACAKQNLLRYFVVVGLDARLDATLGMLRRQLGMPQRPLGAARAKSLPPPRLALSAADEALVRHTLANDFALYDFATELFDRQLADGV